MSKHLKIPKPIQQALDEVDDYRLERGSKHIRIFVGGMFAGIVPGSVRGDGQAKGFGQKNVVAQIRRAARGVPA